MTRAKSRDRNRIRLGARCVRSRCVQTPEISEPSRCGKTDSSVGANPDISLGAFRSLSRSASIDQRYRSSVAPREMSEHVGNFTPPRNVREFSEITNLFGAPVELS